MAAIAAGTRRSYDVASLKAFILEALTRINFTVPKGRVLLKPNLVMGRAPRKAVNTHPAMVRAVGEIFLDAGCDVLIGDSPGYESTERALKGAQIMPVVKDLGLRVAAFDRQIEKRSDGISPYRSFTFGEDPEEYDLIVNLPKLKTHGMMGLTLAVKNTFGFIPRYEKARWHLRGGRDRLLFAAMLIDIFNLVRPGLSVLDGIVGMDGEGPSSGRPRDFGLIAVADDAYALDAMIEKQVGLTEPLPLTVLAQEHGLLKEARLVDLGVPAIHDFEMPASMMSTEWNLPSGVRGALRHVFLKKPRCRTDACKKCGVCVEVCPAGAITRGEEFPTFDYSTCIRCYCCQELCPHGAITV